MTGWTGVHSKPVFLALAILAGLGAATTAFPEPTLGQCFRCDEEDQCVKCDGAAECEAGGAKCTERYEGGSHTCWVERRCECVKVDRSWWFDSDECTPSVIAVADPWAPTEDARRVEIAGMDMTLRRVGERHFAAVSCGDLDSWIALAREVPGEGLRVTTNPLAVRLHRWAYGLEDPTRATATDARGTASSP